jgi:hypothetical protein
MVVYAPQRNVYEIHKVAISNSITALNYMPMELVITKLFRLTECQCLPKGKPDKKLTLG